MADTAITIASSRITPLVEQEQAAVGYSIRFRVLSTDILYGTGATDTVTMTLGPTPTKFMIDKAVMNITTAFAGITAMTVIVGTTTSTAALIASTSILTAATIGQAVGVPVLTNTTATAAKNLVATFTAAGTGGPAGLTAGQLDIFMRILDTSRLP